MIITGQIITTSAEVTLNGGLIRELPQNPLNSGLGIILICPDNNIPKLHSAKWLDSLDLPMPQKTEGSTFAIPIIPIPISGIQDLKEKITPDFFPWGGAFVRGVVGGELYIPMGILLVDKNKH